MKKIVIPKRFGYPTFDIVFNYKRYTLNTGVEIEVDDGLAEVIQNSIALQPKEDENAHENQCATVRMVLSQSYFRGKYSTNAEIEAIKGTQNDFAYSVESGTVWTYSEEKGWEDSGEAFPNSGGEQGVNGVRGYSVFYSNNGTYGGYNPNKGSYYHNIDGISPSDILPCAGDLLICKATDGIHKIVTIDVENGKFFSEFLFKLKGNNGSNGSDGYSIVYVDSNTWEGANIDVDSKCFISTKPKVGDLVVSKNGLLSECTQRLFDGISTTYTLGYLCSLNGLSAYEIAVRNGFNGSEQDWLNSLKGSGGGGSGTSRPIYLHHVKLEMQRYNSNTEELELITVGFNIQSLRKTPFNIDNEGNTDCNMLGVLWSIGQANAFNGQCFSDNNDIEYIPMSISDDGMEIRAFNIDSASVDRFDVNRIISDNVTEIRPYMLYEYGNSSNGELYLHDMIIFLRRYNHDTGENEEFTAGGKVKTLRRTPFNMDDEGDPDCNMLGILWNIGQANALNGWVFTDNNGIEYSIMGLSYDGLIISALNNESAEVEYFDVFKVEDESTPITDDNLYEYNE